MRDNLFGDRREKLNYALSINVQTSYDKYTRAIEQFLRDDTLSRLDIEFCNQRF